MYEDIKNVCLYVRYSSNNQTEQSIEALSNHLKRSKTHQAYLASFNI